MSGVTIQIQAKADEILSAELLAQHGAKALRKQTYIAMNQATADGKRVAVKAIAAKVMIAQKVVSEAVVQTKRATEGSLESHLTVKEGKRISLKYFGARQTAKGVSYRIGKDKGRTILAGAFGPNIPKLGGHVYVRAGKPRLPIIKQFGVSPWGVYVKNDMIIPVGDEVADRFEKRLRARVRYLNLKAAGAIK